LIKPKIDKPMNKRTTKMITATNISCDDSEETAELVSEVENEDKLGVNGAGYGVVGCGITPEKTS
jgi:hypothetical protein